MHACYSRRHLLKTGLKAAAAATGAAFTDPLLRRAISAPTQPVAVSRCMTYGPELVPTLDKMFDQLGGLGRIVKGKSVAMKINLTGAPSYRVGYLPCEDTHYTHPRVIAATIHLMSKAGARRIRLLESPWSTADAIEEYILQANWEPRDILGAGQNVEFENTNFLGNARKYARMKVPFGGYMFPAFDLNHSYNDCDVFVSIAKMKEHATAGITLSMKNCFGITPATIYGAGAGIDEPSILPARSRTFHRAFRAIASRPKALHPNCIRIRRARIRTACRAPSSTWSPRAPSIWRLWKASRP